MKTDTLQLLLAKKLKMSTPVFLSFLKVQQKVCLGILVISIIFASMALAAPKEKTTELRTWTSLTGHQITAEFVGIKGETLSLKDADGKEVFIRLPMLTSTDQALAKKLNEQPTKGNAQTETTASNLLPVFTTGEARNYHAIYSHKNFTAKVTDRGTIIIQCLEGGEPVGEPMNFTFHYEFRRDRNLYSRPLTEFTKFPMPTVSPTLLEFEATVKDGVTAGVSYAFIDNTIQVWGWVVDPPEIEEPTQMRLYLRFKASHTFPPEMLVSEQKKELEPYTLVVTPKRGKIIRFPYGNAVPQLYGLAREMTVEGPVFGNRSVSVSIQSQRNTTLSLWIYQNYAPYQGYIARLLKDNQASKSDKERMIITID